MLETQCRQCCECSHARGEAVIDEYDRSSFDARRRAITAKASQPSLELGRLLSRDLLDVRVAHVEHADRLGIEETCSSGRDRADPELLMSWSTELSRDEEVERCVDGSRDLVAHWHATARNGENERIFVAELRQPGH